MEISTQKPLLFFLFPWCGQLSPFCFQHYVSGSVHSNEPLQYVSSSHVFSHVECDLNNLYSFPLSSPTATALFLL